LVIKYKFKESDIPLSGPDQLLPKLFGKTGGMKRFAVADDEGLRAGFTKILKGAGFNTFFWYDEIWYVIDGKMDVKAVTRSTGATDNLSLEGGDAFYIPTGTHITTKVLSDRIVFLYVAVPASIKTGRWLAHMTPEDIQDVKSRAEFNSKDAWTSGRAAESSKVR
jgi:mannose-6-phosphate isomerase-like protein (cupin superfamily)